jgi:hypothetical protein
VTEILLGDFLHYPAQYDKAESVWRDAWKNIMRETGQESLWKSPWMNTVFNDGTPFRDGNPIFTAVCPTRQLGVRVVQVHPEDGYGFDEISAWTDTFGEGEPDAIKELVIDCVLCDTTLATAADLMKRWVTDENGASFAESLAKIYAVIDKRSASANGAAQHVEGATGETAAAGNQ